MSRALVLCLLLTACNTPSPHFAGIPAVRTSEGGSTFDIRISGNLAEAIRVNSEYAPRMGPIVTRAELAIERVSGCTARRIRGDAAMIVARLKCRKRR